MHTNFADWYRLCTSGVATQAETLEKRWTGVEFHSDCSTVSLVDLVRILLGKNSVPVATVDAFRKPFKDADVAFYMSGNELELQVLSGSVLGLILSEPSELADQAALAIKASNGFGKDIVWCRPFVSIADSYLSDRLCSLRARKQNTLATLPTKGMKTSFEAMAAALSATNAAESGTAATKAGEAITTYLASLSKQFAQAVEKLELECNLRREESDILWWMTSGVSRDFNQPFTELKQLASSVVAGKELAELVSPPGIFPNRALLLSVIPPGTGAKPAQSFAVKAAVNAIDASWREQVSSRVVSGGISDICPILSSIKHSLNGASWDSLVKKEIDFDPTQKFEPIEIAVQTYIEFLLLKTTL
jgi:hypothetical protein